MLSQTSSKLRGIVRGCSGGGGFIFGCINADRSNHLLIEKRFMRSIGLIGFSNENHFGLLRPLIFAGKTEAEERLASLEESWNRPCLYATLVVHHPLVVSLHLVPARNVLLRVTSTGDADSCAGQRAASRPASILCIRLAG